MALLGYSEILFLIAYLCCFLLSFLLTPNDGLPRRWPILGMLPNLLRQVHRIHGYCEDVLSRTKGTFLFEGPWFSSMDMLATANPADIHYIMSSNFSNFPKGPQFRKIFDLLGDGIFNSDSDSWRNQRELGRLLISHPRFIRFSEKTNRDKVEKGLIPLLEHASKQGLIVDLQDWFQRFTFDTTSMLVTGNDPGCLSMDLPEVLFSKSMDDAEEAIFLRHVVPETIWKLQRWIGVGHEKKLSEAWENIDRVIYKYISTKREKITKGIQPDEDEDGVDLLASYLSKDRDEDKREITGLKSVDEDKFLRDMIMNFMIAGRDTTSSALTWFVWLVSTHPEVESKIREELKTAIPPEEESNRRRLFSIGEVRKLVYLHGAICESLRLYPPVPFQHKEPLQPDVLPSGHRVHPKMKIMFSLYAMGRMKFLWGEDCTEFKPERWISERGTIKHQPSYKFLSFNAGPRTCLGKELAFNQIKAVAAAIIHNYHVRVVEGHDVSPNVSIILYAKHGLKVKVTNRW